MKKFVKVVCLFLVCSNFCIFSVEKSENANKKTAIRCMDLAESCIYGENFEDAIKNVNMGLQYDDSISDLYYLKASAFVKLGRTKNEILQEIKIAFDKNNWLGYNKDGARILYADLLCDTAEHEKSLEILDEENFLFSADAEFIRIKNYYSLGTENSIKQAREKINSSRKIFPKDDRFPLVFFLFESLYKNHSENNGIDYVIPAVVQKIADDYIAKLPDYDSKNVDLEILAADFANQEEKVRLLKAIDAKKQNSELYPIIALRAGVINEEEAYNLFFNSVKEYVSLEYLQLFVGLIKDEFVLQKVAEQLEAFDLTLCVDYDLDLKNELTVKYNRGRANYIYYDKNYDGIDDLNSVCDFGVPVAISYPEEKINLNYEFFPNVSRIVYMQDDVVYSFLDDDLAYSPFDMILLPCFEKVGVSFYVPHVAEERLVPDSIFVQEKASTVEYCITERPNAKVSFSMFEGDIVFISFTDSKGLYARVNLSEGYPFVRNVDYNDDGFFETSEYFDLDYENKFALESDKKFIESIFGTQVLPNSLYLKKVEIDKDKDAFIEFREEYIDDFTKCTSWDYDDNGIWDCEFVQIVNGDDLETETVYFDKIGLPLVKIKVINAEPISISTKNGEDSITLNKSKTFYWVGEVEDEECEKYFNEFLAINKLKIENVFVTNFEEDRFFVIKAEEKFFVKKLEPSFLEDE